jgi:hypothetical protein
MLNFLVTVTWADGGDFRITLRAKNKAEAMIQGEHLARQFDRATAKIKKTTAKVIK